MARRQNSQFPGDTILAYLSRHFGRDSANADRAMLEIDSNNRLLVGDSNFGYSGIDTPMIAKGGFGGPWATISTNTILTREYFGVYCSTAGGDRLVSLPTAGASVSGQIFIIKKTSELNLLSIEVNGGGAIDQATTVILSGLDDCIVVQCITGGAYKILSIVGAIFTPLPKSPTWFKIGKSISHTTFQVASLTKTNVLTVLGANAFVHGIKLKHSTSFAGTGITAYTLSVAWAGEVATLLPAYDVLQATGSSTFAVSQSMDSKITTGINLEITAISTGANLSLSTAGVVDVWALLSSNPS